MKMLMHKYILIHIKLSFAIEIVLAEKSAMGTCILSKILIIGPIQVAVS